MDCSSEELVKHSSSAQLGLISLGFPLCSFVGERPAGRVTVRVCIYEGKIRICVGFSSVFSLQESINQIKATIAELETVGEEHMDDVISSLVIIHFL